jgi:hypothetical protein
MMHVWVLLAGLAWTPYQAHNSNAKTAPAAHQSMEDRGRISTSEDDTDIGVSRCLAAAESPSQRVSPPHMIAPGPPPLLSFRYYEGREHYRFGNNDLMLDDAGH